MRSIVGVEVLARYMHPVMGMLDPSSFLPPGTEPGMFDKFDLEEGTTMADMQGDLEAFGYEVELRPLTSGLHAIEIGAVLKGAADPRREGIALGE